MNRPRNQKEGAGNAGCALHPWPPVQKESTGVSNQGYTATAGIPCAMVLRLIRDLLGDHAWLPPSSADRTADLAPASERQDHTTSPSAPTPLVALTIAPGDVRPSHPAPNVRDDREPPLLRVRDGESIVLICPTTQCEGRATDWRDGQIMPVRYALGATARHSGDAPPGRANAPDDRLRANPEIHFATAQVVEWIPGLRLRRIPE
jgi:hypothetical protein